jgi:hypothetical protein
MADEYERRRRALMDKVPEGGVVVVVGATTQYSSPGIL